jgi:hypothetical protein
VSKQYRLAVALLARVGVSLTERIMRPLALFESGKFIRICQVSGAELHLIDGDAELNFEVVESAAAC